MADHCYQHLSELYLAILLKLLWLKRPIHYLMPFSENTQLILAKAGWSPNRNVWTLGYKLTLFAGGYPWFDAVEAFLRKFGGLRVSFEHAGQLEDFHFDVRQAVEGVDSSWGLQNYPERVGASKFCIIGQAYRGYLALYMDDTGKMYGGYDDYLCYIASSSEAAIEALCQNQPVQEIPDLAE
jgi:hypothetical protein